MDGVDPQAGEGIGRQRCAGRDARGVARRRNVLQPQDEDERDEWGDRVLQQHP